MATAATIKKNIAKLEAALKSKATPKSLKPKLETQLVKSKAELSGMNKGTKPKTSSTKSTQTALQKLKAMVNKNKKYKTYKGAGVDLEKDADRPALRTGKRIAKESGKTYYEYRANRIDVKQPPKKYPKLEDGGMMNEPKYDSAGFSREDDKRIKIYSGNKGKLNEIFNEYKNQKNELRANEVFDNEKMKGKSVFLFVNDDFYDQYVQDEDEESYADENFGFAKGGYMAKGGGMAQVNKMSKDELKNWLSENYGFRGVDGKGITKDLKDRTIENMRKEVLSQMKYNEKNNIKYAKGGKVEDELYVYEYKKGQWTVKDKKNPRAYYTLGSKRENAENARQSMIDKPSLLKYYRSNEYAKGGEVRFVDEFSTNNGIEISTAKTEDGKTLYGAQITMYPLQRIVPFIHEDKDIVVQRAKKIHSDMAEYLSNNDGEYKKMAKGGETSSFSNARLLGRESQDFEKEAREYAGADWDKMSKDEKEQIISDMQKDFDRSSHFDEGGISDKEVAESNAEMVLSQIKAVKHHAQELSNVVSKNSDIEAWVVAKIERASTDLSDITHYLEFQTKKMAMGGEIHRTQD